MKQLLRFMGSAVMATMLSLGVMPLAGAQEPGAHVHGLATLEVALDGAAVQISLDSPLDNLLGFERAPRNEKERQAVRAMALKLHQAATLFVFTPAAQCRLESAELESAVLAPGLLAPATDSGKGSDTAKADSSDVHAELAATWHFQCTVPQALQGVEVRLFQQFSGLKRIDAAVAGPKGQSSAKLSPKSTRLKW